MRLRPLDKLLPPGVAFAVLAVLYLAALYGAGKGWEWLVAHLPPPPPVAVP